MFQRTFTNIEDYFLKWKLKNINTCKIHVILFLLFITSFNFCYIFIDKSLKMIPLKISFNRIVFSPQRIYTVKLTFIKASENILKLYKNLKYTDKIKYNDKTHI